MSREANVLFQTTDEQINKYVADQSGDYVIVFKDNELYVIIKDVEDGAQSYENVRMMAGNLVRDLQKKKVTKAIVADEQFKHVYTSLDEQRVTTAFVEGWYLGNYEFQTYKSKKKHFEVELKLKQGAIRQQAVNEGVARAQATSFSRDLMNEIPSSLNPETFPTILQDTFKDSNVDVIVHDKDALTTMEMNGLLAVNRGSKYDPAFIELHYKGNPSKPLIALVGKGVTFDTGGISLKSGRNLSDMRMDMGGAAAVAGAVKLLAEINADVNVVGLIQTVENMPDRHSLLPGDVITYKNGHTVQIGNTDAEGRLILADGLLRAEDLGADYIVDIATLTGAIAFALGPKMGGIFGDESLMKVMKEIGDSNGDFVWPMPLIEDYDRTLKSDYADFSNISNQSSGGSITAALFLRRFITDSSKWIHVDMAGVMESKEEGYYRNSATGFGARLLADYAVEISAR